MTSWWSFSCSRNLLCRETAHHLMMLSQEPCIVCSWMFLTCLHLRWVLFWQPGHKSTLSLTGNTVYIYTACALNNEVKCKHGSDIQVQYCVQYHCKLSETKTKRPDSTLTHVHVHYIDQSLDLLIVLWY